MRTAGCDERAGNARKAGLRVVEGAVPPQGEGTRRRRGVVVSSASGSGTSWSSLLTAGRPRLPPVVRL